MVNNEGDYHCVNESVCVHPIDYDHYNCKNNVWGKGSDSTGLEGWSIPSIQQTINRIGTLEPKVFGIIDFTAGYHQTPLHPDSQEYTTFITQYGLFEWIRVTMGCKDSGPFFQRIMANKV